MKFGLFLNEKCAVIISLPTTATIQLISIRIITARGWQKACHLSNFFVLNIYDVKAFDKTKDYSCWSFKTGSYKKETRRTERWPLYSLHKCKLPLTWLTEKPPAWGTPARSKKPKPQAEGVFDGSDKAKASEFAPSTAAHRTFDDAPASDISNFIQAFDDDDGILDDLQPLSRLSMRADRYIAIKYFIFLSISLSPYEM